MNGFHYNSENFWETVEKTEGCWNWTGRLTKPGYGQLSIGGRRISAHRFSYEQAHGGIPAGMHVDHICRNRKCVRPDHLRSVTNKQNAENRASKPQNTASGMRGVTWHKRGKKWQGSLMHNSKRIHVGLFSDLEKAAEAVAAKRNELFTHNDADRMATK